MKKIIFVFCSILFFTKLIAQQTSDDITAVANPPAKSGLSYDALTKFFQANITSGNSGGYDFKFTLYAFEQLFTNDSLNLSKYYLRKTSTAARNLEISIGLHKGKDGGLNMLAGGLKYAFINNRDKSLFNFFDDPVIRNYDDQLGSSSRFADSIYTINFLDPSTAIGRSYKQMSDSDKLKLLNQLLYVKKIDKKPEEWQVFRREYLDDSVSVIKKKLQDRYDELSKRREMRSLLTLSLNPEYDWNNKRLDSSTINLQYLLGFGNYKKPWNIDAQGWQLFQRDTLSVKSRNLERYMTGVSLGLNKTLFCDAKLNPIVEFEFAGELDFIESGKYNNEDWTQPKLVTTLRVHITKEISLPVQLKYDLKKPNLWGIFRLQWNLENSKK